MRKPQYILHEQATDLCWLCMAAQATRCAYPDGMALCDLCWLDRHDLHNRFTAGCFHCWQEHTGGATTWKDIEYERGDLRALSKRSSPGVPKLRRKKLRGKGLSGRDEDL
jgi:hypothetical protein